MNKNDLNYKIVCGFAFPKSQFWLLKMDTIGFISDSLLYRMNMSTEQVQIFCHAEGRSYQAIATNHKRSTLVLADYGKNPTIFFQFMNQEQKSFCIRDICSIEVEKLQLSMDNSVLAVQCGLPDYCVKFIDINAKKPFKGNNFFHVNKKIGKLKNMQFNPGNSRIIALQYSKYIKIYKIEDCFERNPEGEIQHAVSINIAIELVAKENQLYETILWDELNNLYISNQKQIIVYSIDKNCEVFKYDIEIEVQNDIVIAKYLLTLKHLIVFYSNGRVQWLNKYYVDWEDEEESYLWPFYLDKYLQLSKNITSAIYNHHFSKIYVSHSDGYFSILPKAAQTQDADEEDEENQDKIKSSSLEKKLTLDIKLIGPYHTSEIILFREIEGKCLSLCREGRIIIWSISQKTQLQNFELNRIVGCADLNSEGNVLAITLPNGVLQFYSIADIEHIYLFKEFRITKNTPIHQVVFSTKSEQLALLDKQNNRIYYLLTNLSGEFEIIGYITLLQKMQSICWNSKNKTSMKANSQPLIVSVQGGICMINSPAANSSNKKGKELELDCTIYGMRVQGHHNIIKLLPNGQIITAGEESGFRIYKQPEQTLNKLQFKSKSIAPHLHQIHAHHLPISYILSSSQNLITASCEGTLQFRSYKDLTQCNSTNMYGWRNNNFALLAASNYAIIYACGKDGSIYMLQIEQNKIQINKTNKWQGKKINFKEIKSAEENLKYFIESIDDQYLFKMKDVIKGKKKEKQDNLERIKQDLKVLLQQNESHQLLEQLSRDEFAIDLHSREQVKQAGRQKCQKIRQMSHKKILYNEVYAQKLKQITWDRMRIHIKAINGLKHNYIVYNYQIRHVNAEENRNIKLILNLRRVQKKTDKKKATFVIDTDLHKNKNVVNAGIVQPLILTVYEKKDEKEEKTKKKQVQDTAEKQELTEEIHFQEIWNLLYSSFQLYSDNAKRNQIIMMKNIIILTKEVFNKEFQALMKLRQNQNEIINDKNKRIMQICFDLKKEAEIVLGRKNILQSSDDILEVTAQEIPFSRYLSKEQRQKLEKERLKQEERLRKLAEDDSSQRALHGMMGGTLEEKKTSLLENVIQREKWMDKPVDDMNEDERMKLKEFEQKKQKANEEKERIIKKLEAELRKLKQQIDEIMEKYDEKLFTLLRRRVQYDIRIQQQEVYCAQLILSMINQQEEAVRKQTIQKQLKNKVNSLQKMENIKEEISRHEEFLEREKQSKKASMENKKLGQIQSKIKTIEKSVFDEYQNNLKKRREMQQKLLETNETIRNQIITLDPMKEIESRLLSAQKSKDFKFFIEEIKVLQQTFDLPDNSVLHILENRFNIRNEQSEYLRKINIIKTTIANIDAQIQKEGENVRANELELEEICQFLEQSKSDLSILCRLKQGQIEINNDKPVPELWNALMISRAEIDEKNNTIMKHANEKIQVMEKIKTCKISVTEETLNLERKEDLINKLIGMIKEIQMLKVKKQMQVALAKKDIRINETQLKSLKEQIQKVRKEGQKRVQLFEKKIQSIIREIDTIRKQNKQLEVQRWNLQSTVGQRQKIKNMMCGENGDNNQEATEKFGQISINRKLFDKAKQQTQQIELLREQLSKLKAKTFANFSNIQK